MAHTEGPWHWSTYNGSHLLSLIGANGERVITHNEEVDYEVTLDDAALLEAAPDMLALCRDLYAEVGTGGDLDWHLVEQGYAERLRVLIEKADGP